MNDASSRPCPRDGAVLSGGGGAVGEDVCPQCQGRFLELAIARRLFIEVMGIREDVLFALAQEGAQRCTCPGCGTRMTETWARGVQVDLCRGCGGGWLDGGELKRLAGELIEEVRVTSAPPAAPVAAGGSLELDTSRRVEKRAFRFEVRCVSCDTTLDLTQTNWLINTRPWCPACARPYTGVLGMISGSMLGTVIEIALGALTSGSRWGGRGIDTPGGLNKTPDVLRVEPADADQYFGSFYLRVR